MRQAESSRAGVLVTRPASQARELIRLLQQHALRPVPFPVLEIEALDESPELLAGLQRLADCDLAVFISSNAVIHGLAGVRRHIGGWPPGLEVAAVGPATVKTLQKYGINAQIVPQRRFDTEGLLAHPALERLDGKRVAIFRGQGGREKLARELAARGAVIEYFEVYRRRLPHKTDRSIFEKWAEQVNIVVCTSNNSLSNLLEIAGSGYRGLVLDTPLLVVSARMQQWARQCGFRNEIIVAHSAVDTSIVDAILKWRQDQ